MKKSHTFILPDWTLCPLFNSDETGITDEQSEQLNEFSKELIANGIHAIPIAHKEHGFCHVNDLEKLGNDCHKVTFVEL